MSQGPPSDEPDLEERVETIETQLEAQSTQVRRLWGALLLGIATVLLFMIHPLAVLFAPIGLVVAGVLLVVLERLG